MSIYMRTEIDPSDIAVGIISEDEEFFFNLMGCLARELKDLNLTAGDMVENSYGMSGHQQDGMKLMVELVEAMVEAERKEGLRA